MKHENVCGGFVWNELMTTDVKAARDFYAGLFGWKWKTENMGAFEYHMAHLGDKPIAGLMQTPEEKRPSQWLSYVSVDDVDARTRRAVALGGREIVPPRDIPQIGRFSVILDPQGACIAPFRGVQEAKAPEGRAAPGDFTWYELVTRDPEGAKKFYPEIFGWGLERYTRPETDYWMFRVGEKTVAGVWPMPAGADYPPHWLAYIAVADCDAAARKAVQLGGKLLKGPEDIPEIGRFAVLADSTGGVFAIFKSKS